MTEPSSELKRHAAFKLVNVLAYLAILGTLGGFFARFWWPLELMCHLRFQYCWFLLLLCGLMASVGYRKHAVVAGVGALLNLALIIPLYFGAAPSLAGESQLRVMSINVLTSNRDYDEVLSIVKQDDPDVVVFLEVDQRWIDGIAAIQETLPHAHVAPRDDNFGIAIYSRKPLSDCRFIDLAGHSIQAVVATANISGKDVRIIGGHPFPPLSGNCAATRNKQLQHMAQLAAEYSGPTILTGDLNTSSWSPYFQDLLRDGELTDTRQGHGLQHTHTMFYLVRLTIDHILVSKHIRTNDRWVTPCIGSDHDAVVADLAF